MQFCFMREKQLCIHSTNIQYIFQYCKEKVHTLQIASSCFYCVHTGDSAGELSKVKILSVCTKNTLCMLFSVLFMYTSVPQCISRR